MAIFGRSKETLSDVLLDQAVRSLRSASTIGGNEHLSDASRAAIIEAAMRPGPVRPPHKAWLVAGFGAVFTVTAALLVLGNGGEMNRPVTIRAAKSDAEVVFTISNGHRAHRVIKSTDLARSGGGPVTVEDGRFRDLAESGPVLVFYRVD